MTLVSSPDQIIAEDLGIIPDDVIDFRNRHHLRGMSVLQFGFTGDLQPIHITQATSPSNKLHTLEHTTTTLQSVGLGCDKEERTNVQSIALPNEAIQATLMRLAKDSNAKISIFPYRMSWV